MDIADWIARIKQHAYDNYNSGGWDYVIETMSDADITNEITGKGLAEKPAATYEEALGQMTELCALLDSHRKDIQGTAF